MSTKRKGHMNGSKVGGSHTTVTDFAGRVGGIMRGVDYVKKVYPGFIAVKGRGNHGHEVRIYDDLHNTNGFRLKVIGDGGVQWLLVLFSGDKKEKSRLILSLEQKLHQSGIKVEWGE